MAFVVGGITDLAGNTVADISATTDASAVSFDSVLPTVTSITIASDNNYDNDNSTSYAKAGDTVTLTFYTSEIVQTPSSTIAQGSATIAGNETAWTSTIAMDASDPDGAVAFTVDYTDLAGNVGSQVTASEGVNVIFDNTSPIVSSITQVSNNADVTRAKAGDVVTVSFASNEDLYNLSEVKVSGLIGTDQTVDDALITKNSGTSWSYDYVMSDTDPEEDALHIYGERPHR